MPECSRDIIAIDPGPTTCGVVRIGARGPAPEVRWAEKAMPTMQAIELARSTARSGQVVLAIECVQSYGSVIGRSVIETAEVIGRLTEAYWSAGNIAAPQITRVYRTTVKAHLLGSSRGKDSHVRKAIVERYGGEAQAKKGGALHGVVSHAWAALAVALVALDQLQDKHGSETATEAERASLEGV